MRAPGAGDAADGRTAGTRPADIRRAGLVVLALAVLHGPFLVRHVQHVADPLIANADARSLLSPFFVPGYASEYVRVRLPVGYKVLFDTAGLIWDPVVVSKVLLYPLLLGTVAALGAAAWRLGGALTALATGALALSSKAVLFSMGGLTPRAFALPVFAGAVLALVHGRLRWLAAIAVTGTALYPSAGMVTGLALAFATLGLPARDRGDVAGWPLRRRLLLVAATAALAVLALVPALTARGFGPRLTAADRAEYPELRPGERYGAEMYGPHEGLWPAARKSLRGALVGSGDPWVPPLSRWARGHLATQREHDDDDDVHAPAEPPGRAPRLHEAGPTKLSRLYGMSRGARLLDGVALLTAVGLALMARRSAAARRLLLVVPAAALGYLVAQLAAPYLHAPNRFVRYALPAVFLVALPAAAGVLAGTLGPARRWLGPAATVGVAAVCLALLGGRGDPALGFNADLRGDAATLRFVASLPERSVLAGWPGGPVDNVPYASRRVALVTRRTHNVFHRAYTDEMRRRMRALIEALFATDPAPLARLRDGWGVTHLLVDLRHHDGDEPTYFEPFGTWVREAVHRGRERGFEVLRQLPAATVFSDRSYRVLELARVAPRAAPAP